MIKPDYSSRVILSCQLQSFRIGQTFLGHTTYLKPLIILPKKDGFSPKVVTIETLFKVEWNFVHKIPIDLFFSHTT
jgi:hypothetical protein